LIKKNIFIVRLCIVMFLIFLPVALPADLRAQEDITPPVLVGLSFTPTTIDVSGGNQDVVFTWNLTDDLVGIGDGYTYLEISSPSGPPYYYYWTFVYLSDITSGDENDGVFKTIITLPQYSETGTWKIQYVFLRDALNNSQQLYTADLADMGFNTDLIVSIAPTADAGPDQTIDEGVIVTLDASNSTDPDDGIASYLWEQTSGTTVTLSDQTAVQPTFTAPDAGAEGEMLTFQLTVTDEGGLQATDTSTVTVNNAAPSVEAGPDQIVDEGESVSFSGSFSDPGQLDTHTIVWDFGDGSSTSDTLTPTHLYRDNGVYTVTLTVTDDDGGVGFDTATVTVNNVAPTVEGGADQTVNEGDTVSFSGSFTDPGADTHTIEWDFGDGNVASGTLTPSHAYGDNGTYTVTITVTDDDGAVGKDALTINVNNVAPVAGTGADQMVNEGETVNFSGSLTDPGVVDTHRIEWAFGDGETASGTLTPTHVYEDNGVYIATLTVTDNDGGSHSDTMTVTVNNVPPTVTISGDAVVNEGAVYTLALSATDDPGDDTISNWTINWADGQDGALEGNPSSATHTYTDDGTYTISAKAIDEDGTYDAASELMVTVSDVPPTITLRVTPSPSNEAEVVTLTYAIVDPGADSYTLTSVNWGDGTVYNSTEHTYTDDGTCTITATFTEDDAASTVWTVSIGHNVNNIAPSVDAGADRTVNEGDTFTSSGSFTDPGADTWIATADYGDNSDAEPLSLNPDNTFTLSHIYADDGTYTVTVTVHDDEDGVGSDTATVKVNNVAPTVDAGPDATINEGSTFLSSGSFTDPGADTWTATVDYGDGSGVQPLGLNEDKSIALSHIYADNGTYPVTVTVSDDDGGLGSATATVTVNNVAPTVEAGPDQTVNEGDTVGFSGSLTDPGADTHTIEWDFGDGATASGFLTPTHAYGDNGTYTVTLMVTDDDGGVGTDTLTVTVNNVPPTITNLVSDSPSNGEIGLSATFADKGWLDWHSGTFYFVDGAKVPGEVVEENEQPDATGTITGTHNYSEEGTYTVSLVVEDDDGGSDEKTTEVLIDKTPPVITISEPKPKYYYNTQDITIEFEIEDPSSNGVSSGLVAESVIATLDGQVVEDGEIIDLSELGDGTHTFKVVASDLAGNEVEEVVIFEVGPAPAMAHIEPHKWSLSWLDPFDYDKKSITAYINLENVEVETILSTFKAPMLEVGEGYGDFVVVEVVAEENDKRHGGKKIRSVTLKYVGTDEVDILASSGNQTWDFYGIKEGDTITIDSGEGEYLESYTVLSYYKCEPPLCSAADIIAETILLNGKVSIIDGSAELITEEPSQLDQPRVIAEQPFIIVEEGRHHVSLTGLEDPERITLEVGNQTIFEDEPYPIRWHDRFSLDEDDEAQMMKIDAAKKRGTLNVYHHNLQEEAKIYLDGALALTILPDAKLLVLSVQFNRYDAISSLPGEALERGREWQVTAYGGTELLNKKIKKHVEIANLGDPEKAKLVVGDNVIFEDEPFPINWKDKCFIVDDERQDMSIYTYGRSGHNKYLSIHCRSLARDAKLYLDGELVLVISPPPDVEVRITGDIELDGNADTFDGSFSGMDEIELKGEIPHNYDIDKTYQSINTSGSPALEVGDMFGDFEVVDFTEGYDDYRITSLEFRYDGKKEKVVEVYEDSKGRDLIGSHEVYTGDIFSVDVSEVEGDEVYLQVGHKAKVIRLAGKDVAEVGDKYHDCTVVVVTKRPEGPPHYIDLTLEYIGSAEPISITAYDGKWGAVIDTYEVDPGIEPSFTIDGSGLKKEHIGGNLVLEY